MFERLAKLRMSTIIIAALTVIGYVPVVIDELLFEIAKSESWKTDRLAGFGLAWGLAITLPCTVTAIIIGMWRGLEPLFKRGKYQ